MNRIMKIDSWRLVLLLVTAVSFIGYPKPASAATVNVAVGWYGGQIDFHPSSVTINPGDQVKWTWLSSGHSTTSGRPGMPNGIWNSGVRNQGATFTHTFNSAATFRYYCTRDLGVGEVIVMSATPTPTPTPLTGPPIVTTNPATLIASFSARLNGSLNPHGLPTTFHFRYGTTTSYGLTTPPQSRSGNTPQNVSANVSNLMANRVYHFRIMASNALGTRFGADRTFTTLTMTGAPVVITNSATNVTASSATLNGSLDPHGLITGVRFQYGTTTSYGDMTAFVFQTGNTYRHIAVGIGGLAPHTIYHFRIGATNLAGTRLGGDRTFTTP
jgi:plastocyanin